MPREDSIGALWIKESHSGKLMMTGEVTVNGEKQQIVCFQNDYKTAENNQPDWRILKSKPREQAQPAPLPMESDPHGDDDVPF